MTARTGIKPGFGIVAILSLLCAVQAWAGLPGDALEALASLPVQDGGRIKPLDTYARETLLNITGDLGVKGQEPVETYLSMMFKPESWTGERVIFVSWMPLRTRLNLAPKQGSVSFEELQASKEFGDILRDLQETRAAGEEFSEEQKEQARLYHRYNTLRMAMSGESFQVIPRKGTGETPWRSPATDMTGPEDPQASVHEAYQALGKAFREASGDAPVSAATAFSDERSLLADALGLGDALVSAATAFSGELEKTWTGYDIDPGRLVLELRYNQVHPFTVAAWLALLVSLLMAFAIARPASSLGQPAVVLGTLGLLGVMLLTTWGIGVRVYLSQRGPISNIYETMVYIGWGSSLFGLILGAVYGMRMWGLGTGLSAAIMLQVAEHSYTSFDPFITPLVPVLRSNWLWFHVQVIILGYAGLFMTITMGHLRLLMGLIAPGRLELTRQMDPFVHRSMQLGSAALGIGIVLGGIWADYSWGRYWGWDPKETWSLITLLCSLAVLHARFAGSIGGFGTSVGAVLGVFPLLMCYYGVNFLLVGLHSYAGSDTNAGATFLQKLWTVPTGLKAFVSFEVIFLLLVTVVRWHRQTHGTIPVTEPEPKL